ncbi:hypothetical protein, partial [Xanthomonas citri]
FTHAARGGAAGIAVASGCWGAVIEPGGYVQYSDNHEAKSGDLIQIDTLYRGKVIACMDTADYLPGQESWGYLGEGIMVDMDFCGLVHYTQESALAEELVLLQRGTSPLQGS